MTDTTRTRLHITPFNSDLVDVVIPPSVRPSATAISFHTVQTFPERGFGYVELPKPDADKLRNKLRGATLRGVKMRIEEAKPDKRKRKADMIAEAEEEAAAANAGEDKDKKRVKKSKSKQKRKDGEIEGFELPADRHVKRGWTDDSLKKDRQKPKDEKDKKRKREPSKYIKGKEVLFRTKLPSAQPTSAVPDAPAADADAKDKKAKKSRSAAKGPVVIHEFEKTKKHPSFLRSEATSSTGVAATFVEGQGWLDKDGNLLEQVKSRQKREDRVAQIPEIPVKIQTGERARAIVDMINPSAPSKPETATEKTEGASSAEDNETSESESSESESSLSSSSDSDTDASNGEEEQEMTPQPANPAPQPESMEIDTKAPTPSLPLNTPATPPKEIHPLEALYKRPKSAPGIQAPIPAPINTTFSFFDTPDDPDDEAANTLADLVPQTPFSQQDLRSRGMRSAAPTPDTAAIGRRFSFSFLGKREGEDMEYGDDAEYGDHDDANAIPVASGTQDEGGAVAENGESEFAKWFWENRGDTNRAWKKRRREVLKTKRQRENRRLSRRVV